MHYCSAFEGAQSPPAANSQNARNVEGFGKKIKETVSVLHRERLRRCPRNHPTKHCVGGREGKASDTIANAAHKEHRKIPLRLPARTHRHGRSYGELNATTPDASLIRDSPERSVCWRWVRCCWTWARRWLHRLAPGRGQQRRS